MLRKRKQVMTSFDHHAELESYNESMRERDETCEFCGSNDPAESATHCLRCAHVILETEMRPADIDSNLPGHDETMAGLNSLTIRPAHIHEKDAPTVFSQMRTPND
jgi:hypothetical protein